MFKKMGLVCLVALSTQVFAGDLMRSAQTIEMLSTDVSDLADRVERSGRDLRSKRRLMKKLQELATIATDMKARLGSGRNDSNPGPIPPRPAPRPLSMVGKCHIDDDIDFTENQYVLDVRGSSVQGIIQNCKDLARATHSRRAHSSAVLDIKVVGRVPSNMQTAVCHIDDDRDMTFNQLIAGTIMGSSISELIEGCKMISNSAYRGNGASGLMEINQNATVRNMVSAVCHIDDDRDMTFNQFVLGKLIGYSLPALSQDCEELARSTFGASSASGLREIRQ